jgi:hypothetical protein
MGDKTSFGKTWYNFAFIGRIDPSEGQETGAITK